MLRSKRDWSLTQEALDKLLSSLDNDREQAGKKYEIIRSKLVKFFEWRGCSQSQEYADRTIDRVAAKLLEGIELSPMKPHLYFHGVALNLLKESWRSPQTKELSGSIEDKTFYSKENHSDTPLSNCLDRCLETLPPESRYVLFQYHQAEEKNKKRRKELANTLAIPMNALRIRVYRIRLQLEECTKTCLQTENK